MTNECREALERNLIDLKKDGEQISFDEMVRRIHYRSWNASHDRCVELCKERVRIQGNWANPYHCIDFIQNDKVKV